MRRIVSISDFCTSVPPEAGCSSTCDEPPEATATDVQVRGGYLERLPLAAVRAGLADSAEIWSFAGKDGDATGLLQSPFGLWERRFRADPHLAPYGSSQMLAHINRHGAPDILCVWGLGITAETLDLCQNSIRIYNSIDVDGLRVDPDISARFDIFLTGSQTQSAEIRAIHPDALIAIMPIGPEFASPETFHPFGTPKDVDIIYVAAAQNYKRHDILFDAMARLPRNLRALCVFGYGEDADNLRQQAHDLGLNVEFIGPPGVSHDEVNRLMNRARIGVVCGIDDGAPAILTEYMLAGLPVLANNQLRCGLQYIRPDTGKTAAPEDFAQAITEMLGNLTKFSPRQKVLQNWAWPHSAAKLGALIATARQRRTAGRP
jgi:glycosyltransferase involved in cell wall biosynthesis